MKATYTLLTSELIQSEFPFRTANDNKCNHKDFHTNDTERLKSRSLKLSSLPCEPSPAHAGQSCHAESRQQSIAIWYEGTAQPFMLTKLTTQSFLAYLLIETQSFLAYLLIETINQLGGEKTRISPHLCPPLKMYSRNVYSITIMLT